MRTSPAAPSASVTLPTTRGKKPVTPASARRRALFELTTEAIALAAQAYGESLTPEQIFRSDLQGLRAIDRAFAASRGQHIQLVARVQRLPDGRLRGLVVPQLVSADATSTAQLEADFAASVLAHPASLADVEVEIYLRTDEERLIDLLDFSEISEEADEDEYVVGYVALANLLRHQEVLRQYGALLIRTGRLRPVTATEYWEEAA